MLNYRTLNFKRAYATKVDAAAAFELRQHGRKLREIRDAIAPGASLTSVHRAIRRAEAAQTAAA